MKAPEEIFKSHASRIMKQFDMDNFKRDYPSLWKTIEETLKSMQSDHEKELIGFAVFAAQMEVDSSDRGLEWQMAPYSRRIELFRKG